MRIGGYLLILGALALNIFFLWDKYPSKVLFITYGAILAA
jgi:hypothetical protein